MDSKLKINIQEGILEVEGSEKFVKEIYDDFKDKLQSPTYTSPSQAVKGPTPSVTPTLSSPKPKAKKSPKTTKPSSAGTLLTSLNLRPPGKTSLKDYVTQFKKPTSEEKILIFIYYLKEELKEDNLTLDHIFTCLREIGDKIPTYLKQVVTNVKNNKGWIDTTNWESLTFTTQGMNHIEHDIERN